MRDQPHVYVGGPIDFVPIGRSMSPVDRAWQRNRDGLVAALRDAGMKVTAAHENAIPGAQAVEHLEKCEAALCPGAGAADVAVLYFPPDVVTYGTPIEAYRFWLTGRPVFAIGGSTSVALQRLGVRWPGPDNVVGAVLEWRHNEWTPPWVAEASTERRSTELRDGSDRVVGVIDEDMPADTRPLQFRVEDGLIGPLPVRHYNDDAGVDLWVTERTVIPPGEFRDVPAGCRVQLPAHTFGVIVGRSSTVRKRGVIVITGVIDVGWRGPLFVGCFNAGRDQRVIEVGDRVGQLILLPNITEQYRPVSVDRLSPHPRGENGFGSTGGVDGL